MVVNIQWHPGLEKKMDKIKKSGEGLEKFGEEFEKFGEELVQKGENMEKTIMGRDIKIITEPITDDSEFTKLRSLFREIGIDPVQVLRRAYLNEVSKISDAEQRNITILRCLNEDQQKEVSTELITILKSKFSMDKKPEKVGA